MSGHSKWSQIKRKKAATDEKRGRLFSKLSQKITLSARQGTDPQMNPSLRAAIEEAKSFNMPMEKVKRAIEKAAVKLGKGSGKQFEYGVVCPKGLCLIIKVFTDNQKRTLSSLKQFLNRYGAKLGDVKWRFENLGCVIFQAADQVKEEIELELINLGVLDFQEKKGEVVVYVQPERLNKIVDFIKKRKLHPVKNFLFWKAKNYITDQLNPTAKKDAEKFIKELSELEDVEEIYSNL